MNVMFSPPIKHSFAFHPNRFLIFPFVSNTLRHSASQQKLQETTKLTNKIRKFKVEDNIVSDVYSGAVSLRTPSSRIPQEAHQLKQALLEFSENGHESIQDELDRVTGSTLESITACGIPNLNDVTQYLFLSPSKRFRASLVLLLNRVLAASHPFHSCPERERRSREMLEISETIHVASMLHDDVLDESSTRRGKPSAHKQFSNREAILSGDYLLARACRMSADLASPEIMARVSIIVENLVKGEFLQSSKTWDSLDVMFHNYLTKTYYKTAALMAQTCICSAILGGYPKELQNIAFRIGVNTGMAFQLYDDLLDFTGSSSSLGKPTLQDLETGLVTAPVYMSWVDDQEFFEYFKTKDRVNAEEVLKRVQTGNGIERTELCILHYAGEILSLLESLKLGGNDGAAKTLISVLVSTLTRKAG